MKKIILFLFTFIVLTSLAGCSYELIKTTEEQRETPEKVTENDLEVLEEATVDTIKSPEKVTKNTIAEDAFYSRIGRLPIFTAACFPTFKQICTLGECEESDLGTTFTLLNNYLPSISRCDDLGCDTYDAQYEISGIYENYQPITPRGFLVKKELTAFLGGSEPAYVEIATTGVTTITYSGYCKDIE